MNREAPSVCCLLMQLRESVCATLTRRGQVAMIVDM
jgi:hypothetical protein